MLWHSVSIDIEGTPPPLGSSLRYLDQSADHAFPPVTGMRYVVRSVPGGYDITEDGDPLRFVSDEFQVLNVLYGRINQRAFELAAMRGWVRLHAATIDLPGCRTLMAAVSGTGKTTLTCALGLLGVSTPADESVLVREGESIPVPRRFHVKEATRQVLPALLPALEGEPAEVSPELGLVTALDPRRLGLDWRIERRPVDAIVALERTGQLTFDRFTAVDAAQQLVQGCFRNTESLSSVFSAVSSIARTSSCHRLQIGTPTEAAALLKSELSPW